MKYFSKYLVDIKSNAQKLLELTSISSTTPNMTKYWEPYLKESHIALHESNCIDFLSNCSANISRLYNIESTQIGFSIGASQVYFQTIASLTERGDTVIIESPTYEPMKAVLAFLGLNIIEVDILNHNFPQEVLLLNNKYKPKACIFTSPNVPTGKILSKEAVHTLQNLGCPIIVDECYLPLFSGKWSVFESFENIVSISNCSKTTGLSSLRVGWYVTGLEGFKQKFDKIGTLLHVDIPTNPIDIFVKKVLPEIPRMHIQFKKNISTNYKYFIDNHLILNSQAYNTIQEGGYYTTLLFNSDAIKHVVKALSIQKLSVQTTDIFDLKNGLRISLNSDETSFMTAISVITEHL